MSIVAARLVAWPARELGVGPRAGLEDLARAGTWTALMAVDRARADVGPLAASTRSSVRVIRSGPASNSLPFGQHEHERVERHRGAAPWAAAVQVSLAGL